MTVPTVLSLGPAATGLLLVGGALVLFVLGAIAVTRLQRRMAVADQRAAAADGRPTAAPGTREEFVRRHRYQPGVVANGETLLDLYDRIGRLEARVAELEATRTT